MEKSYLNASNDVIFDLDRAELEAVAAFELLDRVIEPVFGCNTCKSVLKRYAEENEGSYDKAAREWMEEYFDALSAAFYACRQLVCECSEKLQMLPVAKR